MKEQGSFAFSDGGSSDPKEKEDEEDESQLTIDSLQPSISTLKTQLRCQEEAKILLRDQCLKLESKSENLESQNARLRLYKVENQMLKRANSEIEYHYQKDVTTIVEKMAALQVTRRTRYENWYAFN